MEDLVLSALTKLRAQYKKVTNPGQIKQFLPNGSAIDDFENSFIASIVGSHHQLQICIISLLSSKFRLLICNPRYLIPSYLQNRQEEILRQIAAKPLNTRPQLFFDSRQFFISYESCFTVAGKQVMNADQFASMFMALQQDAGVILTEIVDWVQATFYPVFQPILPNPNPNLGLIDKRKQTAKDYLRTFGVIVSPTTTTGNWMEFSFTVMKWTEQPRLNKTRINVTVCPQFLTINMELQELGKLKVLSDSSKLQSLIAAGNASADLVTWRYNPKVGVLRFETRFLCQLFDAEDTDKLFELALNDMFNAYARASGAVQYPHFSYHISHIETCNFTSETLISSSQSVSTANKEAMSDTHFLTIARLFEYPNSVRASFMLLQLDLESNMYKYEWPRQATSLHKMISSNAAEQHDLQLAIIDFIKWLYSYNILIRKLQVQNLYTSKIDPGRIYIMPVNLHQQVEVVEDPGMLPPIGEYLEELESQLTLEILDYQLSIIGCVQSDLLLDLRFLKIEKGTTFHYDHGLKAMRGRFNDQRVVIVFGKDEDSLTQFRVQDSVRFNFVQRVYGFGMYFGYPCVVLEAIALGSLENFMYLLDWNESVKFVLELCEAVGLLHTNGIAHGRIKAPNILVTETMKPKLKGFRHAITPARNPEPTKSLPDLKQEDIYKVAELADLLLQRSVLPHTCSVYDDCDTCINPNCQADESAASTSGASMIGLEYVQDIELQKILSPYLEKQVVQPSLKNLEEQLRQYQRMHKDKQFMCEMYSASLLEYCC